MCPESHFCSLVRGRCGWGPGQEHCSNSFLQGKNWAAASPQGILEVSVDDVTPQLWWQIQLVLLQNIQQWILVILFITWLLLFLFQIPVSFTPSLLTQWWIRHGFVICFPSPPLKKNPSFWDFNTVIVDPTSPPAFYPNIPQLCWFYDFLAHLLLEFEFARVPGSAKKFRKSVLFYNTFFHLNKGNKESRDDLGISTEQVI